ncbi:MAG TPA: TonB family protein [Terriglobales bacterium]|nr:TonB family protein [Terriglobales bacterium]
MGYQALLFCVDEKLTRVVSQLFSDLEFAVSAVNDPFAAVKNLMAQHYDAVVIDCENEQSASLLVKSARNSSFNQGSLAIALVEGQAGIAKAYRMGANLVLPKPINIDQAKGTLRVARGLLRKGTEPAGHAVPGAQAKAVLPVMPTLQYEETPRSAPSSVQPEPYTAPAASQMPAPAFAKAEEVPAHAPAAQTRNWAALAGQAPFVEPQSAPAPVGSRPETPVAEPLAVKPELLRSAAVPFVSVPATSQGAASAPAPAKEPVAAGSAPAPVHEEEFSEDAPFRAPQSGSAIAPGTSQAPSFSMGSEQTGTSGGGQKILIGAAAVFLVVAAYFGWTKFGQPHSTPSPAASPVATALAPAAQAGSSAPASSSEVANPAANQLALTTAAPGHAAPSSQPAHSPSTPAASVQTAARETEEAKLAPAPLMVKPGAISKPKQTQPSTQPEDASVQAPSALGVASPNEASLNGLLPTNAAKPSLARVRVSQGVSQGLLIKRVQPKYPVNALATHTQGSVQIEATIDKEGHVLNPKVLNGSPLLASAALEAVRQWRYKPYELDGQPVEIQTQITIVFKTE